MFLLFLFLGGWVNPGHLRLLFRRVKLLKILYFLLCVACVAGVEGEGKGKKNSGPFPSLSTACHAGYAVCSSTTDSGYYIDPLHKWHLHLNNNTYTSLASHS